jgi:hypothetical protein
MPKENLDLPAEVQRLNQLNTDMWWSSGKEFPRFKRAFSPIERWRYGRGLDRLTNAIVVELAQLNSGRGNKDVMRERIMALARPFICKSLGLQDRHIDLVLRRKFIDVSAEFANQARKFDASLTDDNIYQAARNVMSMNFMQLLLEKPVELTPAVFAYSTLYPLTDNYLDNPDVSAGEKLAFSERFRKRLQGEKVAVHNDHEKAIWELVDMVERQFERSRYTNLYNSLIAIHDAQKKSMAILNGSSNPSESSILAISFEKGGTSVLADGYLVAGELSQPQREFTYGYGCFTQLMDDIEDIQSDMDAGIATLFSTAAHSDNLDRITSQLFNFGDRFILQMEQFASTDALILRELVWTCTHTALIGSMVVSAKFFSRDYLKQLQAHYPYPFRALGKQQKKLQENGVSVTRLVDAMG